jgi:hypothetical protein
MLRQIGVRVLEIAAVCAVADGPTVGAGRRGERSQRVIVWTAATSRRKVSDVR